MDYSPTIVYGWLDDIDSHWLDVWDFNLSMFCEEVCFGYASSACYGERCMFDYTEESVAVTIDEGTRENVRDVYVKWCNAKNREVDMTDVCFHNVLSGSLKFDEDDDGYYLEMG